MATRRDFLKLSAASLALLVGSTTWPQRALANQILRQGEMPKGREYIMMCDTPQNVDFVPSDHIRHSNPGSIKGICPADGENFSVDVPFFGHAVAANPMQQEQVVSFEKWGTRGVLVDVRQKNILTLAEASPNCTFFGHAAYNGDGTKVITTEIDQSNYGQANGWLVARDAKDMKILDKFASQGSSPHECRTVNDGKTFIVVNGPTRGKQPASLVWIEFESGKVLNKIELNNVDYGHFSISADGWICVVGTTARKYNRKMVAFVSPEGEIFWPNVPKDIETKMSGEALSVEFLDHMGLVAVTLPNANLLLIFDYKQQTLMEAVPLTYPKGVLASLPDDNGHQNIIVSSNKDKNNSVLSRCMMMLSPETGQPVESLMNTSLGGLGAHLARIYL